MLINHPSSSFILYSGCVAFFLCIGFFISLQFQAWAESLYGALFHLWVHFTSSFSLLPSPLSSTECWKISIFCCTSLPRYLNFLSEVCTKRISSFCCGSGTTSAEHRFLPIQQAQIHDISSSVCFNNACMQGFFFYATCIGTWHTWTWSLEHAQKAVKTLRRGHNWSSELNVDVASGSFLSCSIDRLYHWLQAALLYIFGLMGDAPRFARHFINCSSIFLTGFCFCHWLHTHC